jgi:RES domain-containing protein
LATAEAIMLTVYRIVVARDASQAYSGLESLENGGRWSAPGSRVVYAAGSVALAALEALVHLDRRPGRQRFVAVPAVIPPAMKIERCVRPPADWRALPPRRATRRRGSQWLRAGRAAVFAVPSVIVPTQLNYLLAPEHPDFELVTVGAPMPFRFDPRLAPARSRSR